MSALTNYSRKQMLEASLSDRPIHRPTELYLALFTGEVDDEGQGPEVQGNGYDRQPIAFQEASESQGNTFNEIPASFTASGGDWGIISHICVFDDLGNPVAKGSLNTPREILDGESAVLDVEAMEIGLI